MPVTASDVPTFSGVAGSYDLWTDWVFSFTDRNNPYNCPLTTYLKKSTDNSIISQTSVASTPSTTYPTADVDDPNNLING